MVEASLAGFVEVVTTSKMRNKRSKSSTQQAKTTNPPMLMAAFLKRYRLSCPILNICKRTFTKCP